MLENPCSIQSKVTNPASLTKKIKPATIARYDKEESVDRVLFTGPSVIQNTVRAFTQPTGKFCRGRGTVCALLVANMATLALRINGKVMVIRFTGL